MSALLHGRTIVLTRIGPLQPVTTGSLPERRAGALALHLRMCIFCDEAGGYYCAVGRPLRAGEEDTGEFPVLGR